MVAHQARMGRARSARTGNSAASTGPQARAALRNQSVNRHGPAGRGGTVDLVVADARRPLALSEESLPAWYAVIKANASNRGLVRIGDSTVGPLDPGLKPGRVMGLRGDPWIDLKGVFVHADLPGDGIEVSYAAYA